MQSVQEMLYALRAQVDDYMRRLIETQAPHKQDILLYSLGWLDRDMRPLTSYTGKRIRPALCLLTYQALTGETAPAVPIAASAELFHSFSLIHDDVMDRDDERRGRPTAWRIWGDGIAITAGDTLFALAFSCLRDVATTTEAQRSRLYAALADTGVLLGKGQHLDMSFEQQTDVTEAMYLEMIAGKTAALIAYATYGAALLGTEDEARIQALHRFGHALGMAFQIRDDYLNLWSPQYQASKTAYGDLLRKKKTLPVLYILANSTPARRDRLQAIYANTSAPMTQDELAFTVEALHATDAEAYTRLTVDQYIQTALDALQTAGVDDADAAAGLIALAEFLLERDL